jgi:hypothetical protein
VAPHGYIHKCTRTSHEGRTHYKIDNVFCREERHPSILDVRTFRGADCEVRERLAVYRRAVKKTDNEILNLKKLKEGRVKEQYQITIKISYLFVVTSTPAANLPKIHSDPILPSWKQH